MTKRLLFAFVVFAALIGAGNRVVNRGSPSGPSPIGWWKFNDGTGTTAADETGNGNTGTLTNGPTWTTGPNSNGAVSFDGTDDYVAIANEANFDFERTQAFSFSAWIRWNSGASGSGKGVFNKQSTSGNQPGVNIFVDADNSRVRVFLIDSAGAEVGASTSNGSVAADTWTHVAITYDGSSSGSGLEIYLNGSSSTTGSGTISSSILNDNPLWIGRGAFYFPGSIDDARCYNVELSASEVSALYAAGAQ